MIGVKLFLYDSNEEANGYRGEELSQYVLSGVQNTENLTEELDLTEITLQGLPRAAEYEPETKFIIDIYEDDTIMATYHRLVQEDVVEKPILSDDEYFKHSITFIEPSAIAQKRIVDNIAVTYKLKDVNLETRSTYSDTKKAVTTALRYPYLTYKAGDRGFGNYVDHTTWSNTRNCSFGKCFVWKKPDDSSDILFVYTDNSNNTVKTDYLYNDINEIKTVGGVKKAALELPVPHIYWGRQDTQAANQRPPQQLSPLFVDIGVSSFRCDITERDLTGKVTNRIPFEFISNSNFGNVIDPNNGQLVDTSFPFDFAVDSYPVSKADFLSEYLIENIYVSGEYQTSAGGGRIWNNNYSFQFSRFSDRNNPNAQNLASGYITTPEFIVKENHTYSVELSILNYKFGTIMPTLAFKYVQNTFYSAKKYTGDGYINYCYIKSKTGNQPYSQNVINENIRNITATSEYQLYGLDGITAVIASGIPYTALDLAKRAIINSDVYYKVNGVSPVDLDDENSPYPFYIAHKEEFDGKGVENLVTADELALIQINEAFYHQKNLWEILREVGKYAHAIPQITFGRNDKFAISFYKLGTTASHEGENTPISIMNFRKIDDYISACSSYVDNLVQLGGEIKEVIAPKTDSEDYLVRNDTAKLIVSKPIMEILKVEAIAATRILTADTPAKVIEAGTRADITDYIYEQAIYNILSVRYDQTPNKGIALYYELGEKEIKGGDYQLPQAVTNPYTDYSFKKILYSAFFNYNTTYNPLVSGTGGWYKLKVNDFVFEVTYRTKDTARLEHARPDLRHYLLSSKHDDVPKHRQFNNQQDILVDSVAFGASMFGKLVRTGNSNYRMREWCNSFATLKHKGELVIVGGAWYYVARATHIFFPDHIESIVDYSKEYNQLSEIIGIPSEPRFYEISERSAINREVAINDYLLVTTDENNVDENEGQLKTLSHLKDLVFGGGATYLKWANTVFKGDNELELKNVGTFGDFELKKSILSPINAFSCGNTLTYEWDMEDNFSAGDEVSKEVEMDDQPTADNAYRTMRAVQYCDKYGKATLFDFSLYGDLSFTPEQVRALPNSPIDEIIYDDVIDVRIDASQPNFSHDWLIDDGDGTLITPEIGKTYQVVTFENLTATSNQYAANIPDDEASLITFLDGIIYNATGSAAQNGNSVLLLALSPDDELVSITLYHRENGNYYGAELWNDTFGEFQYYVWIKWNNQYDGEYDVIYPIGLTDAVVENSKSGILLKDSRETLHFNYNLIQITDSDRFVLSPFFFSNDKGTIKIVALNEEVNKMSNGYINKSAVIAEEASPNITAVGKKITVDMSWVENLAPDVQARINSIAIIEDNNDGNNVRFILARNGWYGISDNWYIGAPNRSRIFTNKQ